MSKILVIEDDREIRETLEEILVLGGYEVSSASNGLNGIIEAKRVVPDLVLCDVLMPKQDGWQTVKLFRKIPGFENTPFIFLSALPMIPNYSRGLNRGADEYLTKPIVTNELLEVIGRFLTKWFNA